MDKSTKVQLLKMQSLMERMDNHMTNDQASEHIKNKLLKEGLEEVADRTNVAVIDGQSISLSDPDKLVQILTKGGMSPKKAWRVTLGYIKSVTQLGNKKVGTTADGFSDEVSDKVRRGGYERLTNIIDNPETILKGINKGKIRNPYKPDSYTDFIIQIDKVMLMYGREEEYMKQKNAVKADLEKYQQEHPDDVAYYKDYMDKKGRPLLDFPNQSYDDLRATHKQRVPGTNMYQYDDGSYELSFNTPLKVFKKLKTSYYLIKDANTIEEITPEEVQSYVEMFGAEVIAKTETDAIVARVDKAIKDAKKLRHNGDIWTQYKLDSIFMMNFSSEDGRTKLQYYNPNAIVRYVKGRSLKSGDIPSLYTKPGALKSHLDKFID